MVPHGQYRFVLTRNCFFAQYSVQKLAKILSDFEIVAKPFSICAQADRIFGIILA